MISCRDIDDRLMDWLYGELDQQDSSAFDAHMAQCQNCAAQAASLKSARQAFHALPDEEPPAGLSAALLHEAARQAGRKPAVEAAPSIWERFFKVFQPIAAHPGLAACASLFVVVAVAGVIYMRKGESMLDTGASRPEAVPEQGAQRQSAGAPGAGAAAREPTGQAKDQAAATPTTTPTTALEQDERAETFARKSGNAKQGSSGAGEGVAAGSAEGIMDDPAVADEKANLEPGPVGDLGKKREKNAAPEQKPADYPARVLDAEGEKALKEEVNSQRRPAAAPADKALERSDDGRAASPSPPPPPPPAEAPRREAEAGHAAAGGPSPDTSDRGGANARGKAKGEAPKSKLETVKKVPESRPQNEAREAKKDSADDEERSRLRGQDVGARDADLAEEADGVEGGEQQFAGDTAPSSPAKTQQPVKPGASSTSITAATRKRSEEQFKQMAQAVNKKRCADAVGIADALRARDPDYYRDNVQANTGLRKCRTAERERAAAQARRKAAKKTGGKQAAPPPKAAPAEESATEKTKQ